MLKRVFLGLLRRLDRVAGSRAGSLVGLGQDDRQAVEHDHRETDRHHHEGGVDVGQVGDLALDRGDHRGAQDGHDKAGGADLGVRAHVLESQAVDGREHEGEGDGYGEDRAHAEPAAVRYQPLRQ